MTGFGEIGWGIGPWGTTELASPLQDVFLEDVLLVSDEVNYALGTDVFIEDSLLVSDEISHVLDAHVILGDAVAVSDNVESSVGFKVLGATSLSFFSLVIKFSSPVDATFPPFSDPANYSIPGLTVTDVLLGFDQVTLGTTPAQSAITYTLTVTQGRSNNGDLLGPDNTATFMGFALAPTFLAGAISATQVDVVFSTEMLPNEALLDPASYLIRGGPGGLPISVLFVRVSGGTPVRRVSLELATPLKSMETYAVVISSEVTSTSGQSVAPDTYLFTWADMSRPTQGHPLEIPITNFSGEVQGGLLGDPAGQVFFSPAYEAVGASSSIELESVSVCTQAFDRYEFPATPLNSPSLYTFGPGVSSVLGPGCVLWAGKSALLKSTLVTLEEDDVLPKIYDSSTGSLESPIGDSPAIATLREPIDITRASFLNDLRWRTFPGTDAIVFTTADNMTPIGPGPTTVITLSPAVVEVRGPYDTVASGDSVEALSL